MSVDLWLVLIWPVIAFFVCTALLAVIKWLWPRIVARVSVSLAPWRKRRADAAKVRLSARRIQRAVRRPTPRNVDALRVGEFNEFAEKLKVLNPELANRIRMEKIRGLFKTPKKEAE